MLIPIIRIALFAIVPLILGILIKHNKLLLSKANLFMVIWAVFISLCYYTLVVILNGISLTSSYTIGSFVGSVLGSSTTGILIGFLIMLPFKKKAPERADNAVTEKDITKPNNSTSSKGAAIKSVSSPNNSIAYDEAFLKQHRDYEYIKHLKDINPAGGMLKTEDLERLYDVLTVFQFTDKETGLKAFNSFMDKYYNERDFVGMSLVGFFLAVLMKNNFISSTEQKELMEQYRERGRQVIMNPKESENQQADSIEEKKGSLKHSDPNGNVVFHIALDETGKLQPIVNAKLDFFNREMLENLLSTDRIGLIELNKSNNIYILLYDENVEPPYPDVMIWKCILEGEDTVFVDMEQKDIDTIVPYVVENYLKKPTDSKEPAYALEEEPIEAQISNDSFEKTELGLQRKIDIDNSSNDEILSSESNKKTRIPVDELRMLKQLYDSGVLTEDEFREKKRILLGL